MPGILNIYFIYINTIHSDDALQNTHIDNIPAVRSLQSLRNMNNLNDCKMDVLFILLCVSILLYILEL